MLGNRGSSFDAGRLLAGFSFSLQCNLVEKNLLRENGIACLRKRKLRRRPSFYQRVVTFSINIRYIVEQLLVICFRSLIYIFFFFNFQKKVHGIMLYG